MEIYSEVKRNECIIIDTEYKYTEMNVQVWITDVPHVGVKYTILKGKYIKSDIIQDLADSH